MPTAVRHFYIDHDGYDICETCRDVVVDGIRTGSLLAAECASYFTRADIYNSRFLYQYVLEHPVTYRRACTRGGAHGR